MIEGSRNYLVEKNKVLELENVFLRKKMDLIKGIVENNTIGATKILLNKILQDKGQIMTLVQITELNFVDCSVSKLRCILARSEFSNFRAERYWLVNGAFKDLLRKVLKKNANRDRKKNGV